MSYRSLFNKIINLFFFFYNFPFTYELKEEPTIPFIVFFFVHFYGNHDFLSYKLWFKKVETINLDNPHLDFLLYFLLAWPFSSACQRNVYFPHLKVDYKPTHRDKCMTFTYQKDIRFMSFHSLFCIVTFLFFFYSFSILNPQSYVVSLNNNVKKLNHLQTLTTFLNNNNKYEWP